MKKVIACLFTLLFTANAWAEQITVSAAISLRDALTQIAAAYKEAGGDDVTFTFGSSGQLAAQIKEGAPVDAFISAANKQIDELAAAGMVDPATRRIVAGNRLVLVVPATARDTPNAFADLADARYRRIAIGDPKSVPAGDYAMQTLAALKLADALKERFVLATNVRQVLAYVESGDVTAGLVYATDAKESGDRVKVVATADEKLHEPIVYPAAVIKSTRKPAAAVNFLDFLKTEKAAKILTEKGFTIPARPATVPAK